MQVLYIDVYFFLNFTIDILAAFFSTKLLRISTSLWRLAVIGGVGAAFAIFDVLSGDGILHRLLIALCFLILSAVLVSKRISLFRRIKYLIAFYITSAIFGGVVQYAYSLLDRYFDELLSYITSADSNRGALIFALIILFSIGVLRIFIMLFSGSSNSKSVSIKVKIGEVEAVSDALVDSGNLVKDPMSMCPVIFIKESLASDILPREVVELENIDRLENSFKKRIRLVPVTREGKTHVMTGLRPDEIVIMSNGEQEIVDATLVIDKDGGSYGGFECLVPSCIVEDV